MKDIKFYIKGEQGAFGPPAVYEYFVLDSIEGRVDEGVIAQNPIAYAAFKEELSKVDDVATQLAKQMLGIKVFLEYIRKPVAEIELEVQSLGDEVI